MITRLKTAPSKYPVELSDIKEHLNIPIGWTDDDEYIKALIYTVTKQVESFLRRKLITQTWYTYYNAWPAGDSIYLPFGKLQSITAIKYTDVDSDQSTWSTDYYNTDTYSTLGRAVLEYGYHWPTASLHPQNPIEVEFVCGYGDTHSSVDVSIKHAIKLMIDDLYNNRGNRIFGMTSRNIKAAESLLMPNKIHQEPTE